ncbi:MAG TPA: hypothetical protein VJ817_11025 [Gemmatimonadales bacterium]|nr:hypothetical protein [Gemmatimonadales bacterium]
MRMETKARLALTRDERGMALAIALFAIVVIGALVAGTAFAGQLEMGGGRSAMATSQAMEQAETALADAFENWSPNWNALVAGDSAFGPTTSSSGGSGFVNRRTYRVLRLGGVMAFVHSTGERRSAGGNILASRELGMLARIHEPDVDVDAAVEGMGDVRVGGTSKVSGFDSNPSGWSSECTGPLDDVPGVRASGAVQTNGGGEILGEASPSDPWVANDPSVTSQNFQDIYDALVPSVTRTVAGGTYNGMTPSLTGASVCNRSDMNNWGEPGDPAYGPLVPQCRNFMPVTLFTGNTTINNGRGQGIMVVQGDLRIQGTFIFDGIVLATGNIDFHGAGGASSRIYGGIFSANTIDVDDLIAIAGAPIITYSSCAVAAVLASAGRGVPLTKKGWVQIVY